MRPLIKKYQIYLKISLNVRDLTECFEGLITHVEKLFRASLDLAVKIERLPDKYAGSNYSNNKDVLRLLQLGKNVNKIVDSNKKYWEAILDGKTKGELAKYKRIIRDIDFPNQNWKLTQQNKEFYWALSEGCNWFLLPCLKI